MRGNQCFKRYNTQGPVRNDNDSTLPYWGRKKLLVNTGGSFPIRVRVVRAEPGLTADGCVYRRYQRVGCFLARQRYYGRRVGGYGKDIDAVVPPVVLQQLFIAV